MTKKEELLYLLDLQSEAYKWTVDEPDNRYELEVKDRISKLVNELQEPVAAKGDRKKSDSKYSETHVRIHENGQVKWVYREDAEQIETPNGFKWVRKGANNGDS